MAKFRNVVHQRKCHEDLSCEAVAYSRLRYPSYELYDLLFFVVQISPESRRTSNPILYLITHANAQF